MDRGADHTSPHGPFPYNAAARHEPISKSIFDECISSEASTRFDLSTNENQISWDCVGAHLNAVRLVSANMSSSQL